MAGCHWEELSPMVGHYKQRLGFPMMGLSITMEIGGLLVARTRKKGT